MPDRLRLLLGLVSLAILLGSGILMTIFTLRQSSLEVSRAEFTQLTDRVNQLMSATESLSQSPVAPATSQATALTTSPASRLQINLATAAQLDALPGIGPVRAKAILEARAAGRFRDLDDLRARVPNLPSSVLADMSPLITFEE